MNDPRRSNYIKKLTKMIEVSRQELNDDFFNPTEIGLLELIISQQERLLDKMKNVTIQH